MPLEHPVTVRSNRGGADIGALNPSTARPVVHHDGSRYCLHSHGAVYIDRRVQAASRRSRQTGPCWPGDVTGGASCNFASMQTSEVCFHERRHAYCILFALLHPLPRYTMQPCRCTWTRRAWLTESHKCKMHDRRDESKEAKRPTSEVLLRLAKLKLTSQVPHFSKSN